MVQWIGRRRFLPPETLASGALRRTSWHSETRTVGGTALGHVPYRTSQSDGRKPRGCSQSIRYRTNLTDVVSTELQCGTPAIPDPRINPVRNRP